MSPQKQESIAYKIALSAMLAALALIFSYIEAMIPFNFGVPGIKLGVANLVVIIALYTLGLRYSLTINVIRILVAALLFNGPFGAVYSFAGGILSLLVMYLLKETNLFSTVGVSMTGGVVHNLGQLLIAALVVSNIKVFVYFPVLLFSGLISGIVIGMIAHLILKLFSLGASQQSH